MILYERVLKMGTFPQVSERCLNSSFCFVAMCESSHTDHRNLSFISKPISQNQQIYDSCLLKAFLLITDYLAG